MSLIARNPYNGVPYTVEAHRLYREQRSSWSTCLIMTAPSMLSLIWMRAIFFFSIETTVGCCRLRDPFRFIVAVIVRFMLMLCFLVSTKYYDNTRVYLPAGARHKEPSTRCYSCSSPWKKKQYGAVRRLCAAREICCRLLLRNNLRGESYHNWWESKFFSSSCHRLIMFGGPSVEQAVRVEF